MRVDLGSADAAVGIGLGVVTDILGELQRIGRLPNRREFDRDVGGQIIRVTMLLDVRDGHNGARLAAHGAAADRHA